jgi:hypothetical protein
LAYGGSFIDLAEEEYRWKFQLLRPVVSSQLRPTAKGGGDGSSNGQLSTMTTTSSHFFECVDLTYKVWMDGYLFRYIILCYIIFNPFT